MKFVSGWALEWLGAMLTGMGLYRLEFLTDRRPTRDYVLINVIGYLISWPLVITGHSLAWRDGITPQAQDVWLFAPYSLEVPAGTLGNMAAVLLIVGAGRFGSVT